VTSGVFRAYEEGRRALSLPELELLAHFLDMPFNRFWSKEAISDDAPPNAAFDLPALKNIRQRMIGTILRQAQTQANLSSKELAEQSGISTGRLRAYEMGERPIPLPELEDLLSRLGIRIESLVDQTGPVGQWFNQQLAIQDFKKLPPNLQEFVCKPINRPYLDLALKLSDLSTDKLRAVAENILDITF